MSEDPYELHRFVEAQERGDTYARAEEELRRGAKTTHWMWFVFPQLEGLGTSPTARRYAIASLEEAAAYLAHQVLGPRLLTCTGLVAAHERDPREIFGDLDAQKLASSMTLFELASSPGAPFELVLERHFGGVRDVATLELLDRRR